MHRRSLLLLGFLFACLQPSITSNVATATSIDPFNALCPFDGSNRIECTQQLAAQLSLSQLLELHAHIATTTHRFDTDRAGKQQEQQPRQNTRLSPQFTGDVNSLGAPLTTTEATVVPDETAAETTAPASLLQVSTDPAQELTTVRSHASNYHMTVVGGADVEKEQPLFQQALEGYYPAQGYETATPQCKRLINRYLGKCLLASGGGGGARFQQIGLLAQQHATTTGRKNNPNARVGGEATDEEKEKEEEEEGGEKEEGGKKELRQRGQDAAFVQDLRYADGIIDGA